MYSHAFKPVLSNMPKEFLEIMSFKQQTPWRQCKSEDWSDMVEPQQKSMCLRNCGGHPFTIFQFQADLGIHKPKFIYIRYYLT